MNKILIAAAAAFFAVTTLFGTRAEAGFNVRLAAPAGFSTVEKAGCGGYRRSFRKRRYSSIRRAKRRAYIAAKKAAARKAAAKRVAAKKAAAEKAARLAKAEEPKTEVKDEAQEKIAEVENSSIATSKGKVAKAEPSKADDEAEEKVAAARDLGCKQFFPSVGMTLSVPCDQAN